LPRAGRFASVRALSPEVSIMDRAAARTDLFQLLRLAGPVVLARLGIMTMGLTDAVIVGRYSAEQLGFHGLAWAPTSIVVTMGIGLFTGTQVMAARAVGEGRRLETGAVLRRGLLYSLWVGLASMVILYVGGPLLLHSIGLERGLADGAAPVLRVFALSMPMYAVSVSASFWMEGLARPGPGAVAMWVANLVNLGLGLLLVPGTFGLPALGAQGAAWATTGARTFLAVAMLVYIARMPEARSLGVFAKPPREPGLEAEQRRIGYGAGASNFFEVTAFASMTIIAGWLGGLAVAAWAIVLNVASLVFMVPLGLGTAAAVLVGRAYGARDLAGVNRAGWVAFALTAVFGVVMAMIVGPSVHLVAGAYTGDAATLAMAVPAMVVACLMFMPDALQVVVAQALRARGDIWLPTITHLVSYFGVMIPLAYVLAIHAHWGIRGLSAGIVVASVISAGLLLGRFRLLRRRL
jgi:MATE family multidrug resistance protein